MRTLDWRFTPQILCLYVLEGYPYIISLWHWTVVDLFANRQLPEPTLLYDVGRQSTRIFIYLFDFTIFFLQNRVAFVHTSLKNSSKKIVIYLCTCPEEKVAIDLISHNTVVLCAGRVEYRLNQRPSKDAFHKMTVTKSMFTNVRRNEAKLNRLFKAF